MKWKTITSKNIAIRLLNGPIVSVIGAIIAIVIFRTHPERYIKLDVFGELLIFGFFVIFGTIMATILYNYTLKYEINSKRLIIPLNIRGYKKLNSAYLGFIDTLESDLKQNNIEFTKTEERKPKGILPYITYFAVTQMKIPLRVIREKYVLKICVGTRNLTDEMYFEQTLRQIIEESTDHLDK